MLCSGQPAGQMWAGIIFYLVSFSSAMSSYRPAANLVIAQKDVERRSGHEPTGRVFLTGSSQPTSQQPLSDL